MFRFVVLGLLYDGQPRHGYALMKSYKDRGGHRVSTGNFYRELQRLVALDLVHPDQEGSAIDPRRSPYTIAPKGRAEFELWFRAPLVGDPDIAFHNQVLTKILFLADVTDTVAATVLQTWQEDLWLRAKSLEAEHAEMTRNDPSCNEFPARSLLLERRLRLVSSDHAFLEEVKKAHDVWSANRGPTADGRRAGPIPGSSGSTPKTSRPPGVQR